MWKNCRNDEEIWNIQCACIINNTINKVKYEMTNSENGDLNSIQESICQEKIS